MNYTIISASLLATFASAAPLARGTVDLVLATSNDDTATIISIPFGKLSSASAFQKGLGMNISIIHNVPISDSEITCQCFQDAAGTKNARR